MGFVDEEVELILVLQADDTGEVAHSALHGVETLNGDQDLLPGAVGAGLTLRDGFTELALEVAHVVVLEHINDSTRDTSTETDGGVVELIADHEAALSDQSRENSGICDETHAVDGGSFLAHKLSNLLLYVDVQIAGARISARRAV